MDEDEEKYYWVKVRNGLFVVMKGVKKISSHSTSSGAIESIERLIDELVNCDSCCNAKESPETIQEYKATLEHYKNHRYLNGCSHGQ